MPENDAKRSNISRKNGVESRLKLPVDWEEAAERLLKTPAKSTPPRKVKPRKKQDKSSK